jgi:hypothetical protein
VKEQLIKLGAEPHKVKTALMGEKGLDVEFENVVAECANQEKLNVWRKLEQLNKNSAEYKERKQIKNNLISMLVFKKNNEEPYVAVCADLFFYLLSTAIAHEAMHVEIENKIDEAVLTHGKGGSC